MTLTGGLLCLTGGIHLLPVTAITGEKAIRRLYGLEEPMSIEAVLLLQHRALLFGLLGGLCLHAAHLRSTGSNNYGSSC